MYRFRTRSEVALYVWDYFYLANWPAAGDEAAWAVIERATFRIRESELYLDAPTPPDVRLRNARRVRAAVRLVRRQLARLSVQPEPWVVDGLESLGAVADDVIEAVSKSGRLVVN